MTDKPKLTLEPTWDYAAISAATGFSLSTIQKAAASGALKCRREGRRKVATQAAINEWLASLYEQEADRRVGRMARRDQKPAAKRKVGKPNGYVPNADDDILAGLGLESKR